jgi:hypothetical protein
MTVISVEKDIDSLGLAFVSEFGADRGARSNSRSLPSRVRYAPYQRPDGMHAQDSLNP